MTAMLQEDAIRPGDNEEQQHDNENDAAAADSENSEQTTEPAQAPEPSIGHLALRFFVTFWTSLIPAPAPHVNAN